MKSIKDLIKTADAYGIETRALQEKHEAKMKEGWFDDLVAYGKKALGLDDETAKAAADTVQQKTGADPKAATAATAGIDGPADAAAATQGGGADAGQATAGIDGPADAAADAADDSMSAANQAKDRAAPASATPASTASLMKQYQDGGKKAMPEIKKLQQDLLDAGFDPNGVDGKYGNGTFKAVQDFQKSKGLSVDGAAGQETLAALAGNTAKAKAPGAAPAVPDPETQKTIDALNNLLKQMEPTPDIARGGPEVISTSADQDLISSMRGTLLLVEAFMFEATEEQIKQLGDLLNQLGGTAWAQANGAEYQKYIDRVNVAMKNNPAQPAAQPKDLPKDGGNPGGSQPAVAPDATAKAPPAPKVSKELFIQNGTSAANFNVAQMKKKYPSPYIVIPQKDGTVIHGFGQPANLTAYQKTKKGSKIVDKSTATATPAAPQVQAGEPNANADAQQRGVQTASKDNNMNKKAIKEASMNISMNGNNSAEVAELLSMLKNAGMPNAEPVSSMMDEPPMDKHDDMVSKIKMMEPPSDESPCGMGEENIEEWENTPDGYRDEEEYGTTQSMTKDASGGIHRPKKSYPATQDGDNPMALEASIKEQLYKALQEKLSK